MSKEQLLDKKQIITIEPIHDIDAPIERITLTGNVIVNVKKHPFRAEGMHVIFIKKETLLPLHCEIDWLLDQFPTMVYKDKRYYYFEENTIVDIEANDINDIEEVIHAPVEEWEYHLGAVLKPSRKAAVLETKESYIAATARLYITAANSVGLVLPNNVYAEGYGLSSAININSTTPNEFANDIDEGAFKHILALMEMRQARILQKRLDEWREHYSLMTTVE